MTESAAPVLKLPFYYVMVVWGSKYVDMLLEIALPCLLSKGNLPALTNLGESKFLIFTTPEDRRRISQSSHFTVLEKLLEPVFVESPWIKENIPYQAKAAHGHRAAAELAAKAGAYCIYLCPDCLLSDGSLRYLEDVAHLGKKAVLVPGLRLVKESVYAELRNQGLLKPGIPLTFKPREMVEFGLRHLHEHIRRYNWDHPDFTAYPHHCTWNVPGERGLLIRAFQLHPIMVAMRDTDEFSSLESSTIDGTFLEHNIVDWDQIHVECDSDNFLIFSLSDSDDLGEPVRGRSGKIEGLRAMATSALITPLHRYFFTKAIKLHCDDLNGRWSAVEKESGRVMYEALKLELDPQSCLPYVSGRSLVVELWQRVKMRFSKSLQESRRKG